MVDTKLATVSEIGPLLMQSDRWIEKIDFRSKIKSCILTQWKKSLFDPIFFDRAIRSAHPVEKLDFSDRMCEPHCSTEKYLKSTASLTTPHNIRPHHTTAYNRFDVGLTATTAAAHSESAWHILFSVRQQRVPSSERSSACYR